MSESSAEAGPATRPTPRRPRRGRIGLWLTAAAAVGLILASDRLLRSRQNLIAGLLDHSAPVMIPFSETLTIKAEKKHQWLQLHDQLAAARASNNTAAFIKISTDLARFMETELSPEDPRRRQVFLDVVSFAGDSPAAADAYWALLDPDWQSTLKPSYPKYVDTLTKIAATKGKERVAMLLRLAGLMKDAGETTLETQVLQSIREIAPITLATADAMTRLLSLTSPNDPNRQTLTDDLARYEQRQAHLNECLTWYTAIMSKLPAATAEMEKLRASAPNGPMNPFIASIDAKLVDYYVRDGRMSDANKLRMTMAEYDPGDSEEAIALVSTTYADKSGKPNARQQNLPMPNTIAIDSNRWRGKLLGGKFDEADQLADALFAGDLKSLRKPADEEKAFLSGNLTKLSPLVKLEKRTSDLPPELSAAGEAWYGKFPLKPTAKATPITIQSSAELWLTADTGLLVFSADEPRKPLPPAKQIGRDKDVWKDDSVEFFFDPDRWFDTYFQIDVNTAGEFLDGRLYNNGTLGRRQFRIDRAFNPEVTVKSTPTDTGWQTRVVFPREPLIPADAIAIKFNVRRMRHVTEKGQTVLQLYAWNAQNSGPDHRPEQFGWVIIPK